MTASGLSAGQLADIRARDQLSMMQSPMARDRRALLAEVERLQGDVARVPKPRKPQTAPTRADVLAYLAYPDTTIEEAIDYALSYADAYEVPRWDRDPIVIEHGWLAGRCGRCGEELPAALDGPAAGGER